MDCADCAGGKHGVAEIRADGSVTCLCCASRLAPYVMEDARPEGLRLSYMEALRHGLTNLYPAFTREERV